MNTPDARARRNLEADCREAARSMESMASTLEHGAPGNEGLQLAADAYRDCARVLHGLAAGKPVRALWMRLPEVTREEVASLSDMRKKILARGEQP